MRFSGRYPACMKPAWVTLTTILYGIFLSTTALAESPDIELQRQIRRTCAILRWRIIDGEVKDLAPTFGRLTNSIWATSFGEWEFISAKVVQVLGTNGILFERILDKPTDDERFFRLRNYPAQKLMVDNVPIAFLAHREKENFSYEDTRGAKRTIHSYDYGEIPTALAVSEFEARDRQRVNELRAERDRQIAEVTRRESKRKEEMLVRVLAHQHQQASNGYGSFQYELGRRYLAGDGVGINQALAIHWLKSACTNGLTEATNLLTKIQ